LLAVGSSPVLSSRKKSRSSRLLFPTLATERVSSFLRGVGRGLGMLAVWALLWTGLWLLLAILALLVGSSSPDAGSCTSYTGYQDLCP